MKTIGVGLLVALALTSVSRAEEIEDNGLWVAPKYDVLKGKWPHDPAGRLIYGKVLLECDVGPKGFASNCKFRASEPAASGLEQAALELAPLFKAWNPRITHAKLSIDMRYDEPPDVIKLPTIRQIMSVAPREAAKRGISGGGTIRCIVQTTGLARACVIVDEDPPALGFGAATVALAKILLYRPAIRQGRQLEAEITLPLRINIKGRADQAGSRTALILSGAAWSAVPMASEIRAEIDKKIGARFALGQVVLQCQLNKKSGKLSRCNVANATPGMDQFADVAQSLAPKFQANPTLLAGIKEDVAINLTFAFPDMSRPEWNKRYLAHPQWLQTFDPTSKISKFPDAASKAGLKTGTATVDCVIAQNGALTQCEAVRESAPNLGFGDTAIRIGEAFVANLWGEDGLPAEGAHVRMSIQMDDKPSVDP